MSHTDKTDPYWVKVARYGHEEHDHRDGVCELADGTAPKEFWWRFGWRSCHRELGEYSSYWFGAYGAEQDFRRRDERAARTAWRNYRDEIMQWSIEDLEDVDPPFVNHKNNARWWAW
jgi:hypothetical protein